MDTGNSDVVCFVVHAVVLWIIVLLELGLGAMVSEKKKNRGNERAITLIFYVPNCLP